MNNSRAERERISEAAARWTARRDGGLSAVEQAEFDAWCAADPRHAAALKRFSQAWSALDPSPRASTADQVVLELGRRRQRRRRRALAVSGVFALLLTALAVSRLPERASATFARPAVAATPGVLVIPETRTLPDGSVVELKRGAEITVEFSPELRRVVLVRGEAHFRVAKNPQRPFAVDAGRVHVRAVGTAFAVQREDRQIEVLVTEGKIAIDRPIPAERAAISDSASVTSGPQTSAPTLATVATATAGERVVFSHGASAEEPMAQVSTVTAGEVAERLAWREPRVEFSDTPLSDAVATMNRAAAQGAGLRIVLDGSAAGLSHEPITGLFRADNTEAFVRMLELSLPLQAERRGREIVLRGSR
jgi:transmembrane sensor